MTKSIIEQGKDIIASQPDDTLQAGVDLEGAEIKVKKTLGRGWSFFAWAQQLWKGGRTAGAGVQKTFLVARPSRRARLACFLLGHEPEFLTPTHNNVCTRCGWHACVGPWRSDGTRGEGHTGY